MEGPAAHPKAAVWYQGGSSTPARAEEGVVKDVRSVGAGQHNDALRGGKTVHLHQQLVQGILALIIAPCKPAAAPGAPNGINLICTSHKPLVSFLFHARHTFSTACLLSMLAYKTYVLLMGA